MLSLLDRLKYTGQHWSFLVNATVLQEAARLVTRTPRVDVPREQLKTIFARRKKLHARDLANVEAGMYPRELLFDLPLRQFLRSFPRLVADTPRVVRRMRHHENAGHRSEEVRTDDAFGRREFRP